MHTDYFYTKGQAHPVCQDFVIDGMTRGGIHFVILSDGCSSQDRTDIGTRILALETMKMIQLFGWEFFNMEDSFTYVVENAKEYARSVNVPKEVLTATLIVLAGDQEQIRILGMGDGGFIVLPTQKALKQGGIFHNPRVRTVEYKDNYPMYPIYLREKNFYMPDTNMMVKHRLDLETGQTLSSEHSFEQKPSMQNTFNTEDVRFIGIFSDGMECFLDQDNQLIPLREIMNRVTDFKQLKGNFIQRRMSRFLKDCRKQDWVPYDDISFGGIWYGDQDEDTSRE